jgi:hypothetical protein
LAPERLWHQKSADTRKGFGTRKVLTPEKAPAPKRLRHQKALVLPGCFGASTFGKQIPLINYVLPIYASSFRTLLV